MSIKYDAFISHTHESNDWARQLSEELKKNNISVWFDEWQLRPGVSISHALEEGLRSSRVLIFILSKDSLGRHNLYFELGVAMGVGMEIIPILMPDVQIHQLPFQIKNRMCIKQEDPAETARVLTVAIKQLNRENA